MSDSRPPRKAEASPDQGDLFSGTPAHLRPDPHFDETGGEDAPGLAVSLEERNEALQSALTWLGRQARSAAFREIGRRQAEGGRTPAVRRVEAQYSQDELEERLDASERAKTGMEKSMTDELKKAFGYEELIASPLFPGITEEKVGDAFLSGGPKGSRRRAEPGHKEGKQEFEARFKGSGNKAARDEYRQKLKRQSGRIKRIEADRSRSA